MSLFTPTTILTLDEDLIEDMAGETEESKLERSSSTQKLDTLKQALDVLKRLDRGNVASTSPFPLLSKAKATEAAKLTQLNRCDEVPKHAAQAGVEAVPKPKRRVEDKTTDDPKEDTEPTPGPTMQQTAHDNVATSAAAQASLTRQAQCQAILEAESLPLDVRQTVMQFSFTPEVLRKEILPGFTILKALFQRKKSLEEREKMIRSFETLEYGPHRPSYMKALARCAARCMRHGEWDLAAWHE